MATEPIEPAAALRARFAHWVGVDAVMFVSPAAVQTLRAAGVAPPGAAVRCWAPGGGTAQALREWGVAPQAIDQPPAQAAQWDSEALWAVVAPQVRPGFRLWVVRGRSADGHEGRDWLWQRCEQAGATVTRHTVYRRGPAPWGDSERQQAQRALREGAVWLLSSSEAVAYLQQLMPEVTDWHHARALVTHARIAEAAQRAGFGQVRTCRPTPADAVQALESFL
jgi:uroporphyrinogen-III synthase